MATPVKTSALVKKIIKHTDSVYSFLLEPLSRVPKFRSGQFLHFAIDAYQPDKEWPSSRVFSIASSPANRTEISITVSLCGEFTKRMLNLNEGDTVWLKLPYGEFTFDNAAEPLVLIAGGTGITPFISFLDDCVQTNPSKPVKLYYGIRSHEFLIFDDLLDNYMAKLNNFQLVLFCEQAMDKPHRQKQLDIAEIAAENPKTATYFLSGPPAMVANFKQYLSESGIEPTHIRIDEW